MASSGFPSPSYRETASPLHSLVLDHVEDPALLDAMMLEPAGEHLWRVCDRRVSRGLGRFMAFIEEKNDQFEVMQATDDFVWSVFPTMGEALIHVVQTYPDSLSAHLLDDRAPEQ